MDGQKNLLILLTVFLRQQVIIQELIVLRNSNLNIGQLRDIGWTALLNLMATSPQYINSNQDNFDTKFTNLRQFNNLINGIIIRRQTILDPFNGYAFDQTIISQPFQDISSSELSIPKLNSNQNLQNQPILVKQITNQFLLDPKIESKINVLQLKAFKNYQPFFQQIIIKLNHSIRYFHLQIIPKRNLIQKINSFQNLIFSIFIYILNFFSTNSQTQSFNNILTNLYSLKLINIELLLEINCKYQYNQKVLFLGSLKQMNR
ncbi:unnamed protein product [Paramecium primaurelia]|uniref:Uncharacterized protein n=1 Tax=Paramecium primaurelia TaxID=5886 RepID=A0A8S1KI21_PARPR|nr:unnamed protein product [Paramecium primaurelia]